MSDLFGNPQRLVFSCRGSLYECIGNVNLWLKSTQKGFFLCPQPSKKLRGHIGLDLSVQCSE